MKIFKYISIIEYNKDGISVWFPDFEEAYTSANTIDEAITNAEEVLKLTLRSRLKDEEEIPEPTDLKDIKLEVNQYTNLIIVSLDDKIKFDKKTLTIPHDINVAAEVAGLNFSQVLQQALKEKLAEIKSLK